MSYDGAPTFGQRLDSLLGYIAPDRANKEQPLAIKAHSQVMFNSAGQLSSFNNEAMLTHANARGRQIDIPLSQLVKQLPSNSPFAFDQEPALFQASLKNLKIDDVGTDGFQLKTQLNDGADATLFVKRKDTSGWGNTLATGASVFLGTLGVGALCGAAALSAPVLIPAALLTGGVMAYQALNDNAGELKVTQAVNKNGEISIKEHEVALSPFDTDPLASATATDEALNPAKDQGASPFDNK